MEEPTLSFIGETIGVQLLIFDKSIQPVSEHSDTYFKRAYAKSHIGNSAGAIDDYTTTISLDPTYVDAYYNRGIEKREIEDFEGACTDFKKAVELGDIDAIDLLIENCDQ
jgi:tetratricopeptide (TPR) repeat protein